MEEENTQQNKISKLKINTDSTIEKVRESLEQFQQIKEIMIVINYHQNQLKDIFQVINQLLQQQPLVNKLVISFDSLKSLNFEDTIYQLSKLQQITNLQLTFAGDIAFDQFQNQQLSNCLLQFPNLTTLKIELSCRLIQCNENNFRLFEFFKQSPQISEIEYKVDQVRERSIIIYQLMEGIRFLKNLKRLSISSEYSEIKGFVIIDLLEEELKEYNQICELKLDFGYKTIITNHDFHKLGKLLKQQTSLERLTLSAFSSIVKQNMENTGLERYMPMLTSLKYLKLTIQSRLLMKYADLIDSIASMDNLESVILDLSVDSYDQLNNDLIEFSKTLSRIQNLIQLRVSFSYSCRIAIIDALYFMVQLYPLEKLKDLEITLFNMSEVKPTIQIAQIDMKKLAEVFGRLLKFNFQKNIQYLYSEGDNLNHLYSVLSHSNEITDLIAEVNNYYDLKYVTPHKLELNDVFSKKKNLKVLKLNFDSHIILEKNQVIDIFKVLLLNPQLTKLYLSFKSQIELTKEDLNEMTLNLKSLDKLEELRLHLGNKTKLDNNGLILFTGILGQLKHLIKLDLEIYKDGLSSNTLNQFIQNITELKKVKQLTLKVSGSKFATDGKEREFGNSFILLSKIEQLDITLDIPGLKFSNIENLFKQISSLRKIKELLLSVNVQTSLEDCIKLKEYFSKLQLLKVLNFKSFSIPMLYLNKLFDELPDLNSIEYVNEYSDGEYNVHAIKKQKVEEGIPSNGGALTFYQQNKLKINKQTLFGNEEYEKENAITILPFIFQCLTNLTKFELYLNQSNNIGKDYSSLLFKSIGLLINLDCLKIHIDNDNNIGTESINTLGESFLLLPQLTKLSIIIKVLQNNIVFKDALVFCESIRKLVQLKHLELSQNFKSSQSFDENDFVQENGGVAIKIFNSIKNLVNLHTLDLSFYHMSFTEADLHQFNAMFNSLKQNLKVLSLSFVYGLSSQFLEQATTQSIRVLQNLQYLKLNISPLKEIRKVKRLVHFQPLQQIYYNYD